VLYFIKLRAKITFVYGKKYSCLGYIFSPSHGRSHTLGFKKSWQQHYSVGCCFFQFVAESSHLEEWVVSWKLLSWGVCVRLPSLIH